MREEDTRRVNDIIAEVLAVVPNSPIIRLASRHRLLELVRQGAEDKIAALALVHRLVLPERLALDTLACLRRAEPGSTRHVSEQEMLDSDLIDAACSSSRLQHLSGVEAYIRMPERLDDIIALIRSRNVSSGDEVLALLAVREDTHRSLWDGLL